MKLLFVSALFITTLTACHQVTGENTAAKKTVFNSAQVVDAQINGSNQAGKTPVIKTGRATGLITKINLEIGSVELKHDEIKGMMPAMQMEFYVSDKAELENLKIGDKVLFTLEENQGAETITRILKIE
jgi:Cu/Ag efflux protein CusF